MPTGETGLSKDMLLFSLGIPASDTVSYITRGLGDCLVFCSDILLSNCVDFHEGHYDGWSVNHDGPCHHKLLWISSSVGTPLIARSAGFCEVDA